MYNKFQKQSDKVLSSLEPITNKENLRFYDNDNDAYITFHYPVKIDSDRERLIYRYLTLLEIFWRAPYVSEDSGGKKYSLPMELNSKDISPNKYGFLEFKFVPKGNEKIDSTDDAIEVFKAVLEILYGEKLAPNTLESIKDYEKKLYSERLNKSFDGERTHEILKNYRNDVFKIYELIDEIIDSQNMRVPTGVLNEILTEAVAMQQPPSDKGKRLRIYYITQVSVKPPTFVMFVNDKQLTHFSYTRYIENKIREAFGFRGTSIRFINRERKEKD